MHSKKHIAVFDRDPDVLQSAKLVLSEKFKVTTLSNNNELINKLKEKVFDLIIADLRLLPICSKKFLERIKLIDPDIPIILMGVSVDESLFQEGIIKTYTDGVILKPFDIDELFKLIDRTLNNVAQNQV